VIQIIPVLLSGTDSEPVLHHVMLFYVKFVIRLQITGLLNIIINIWMLVKLHAMEIYLERNERQVWMPPGMCFCCHYLIEFV